MGNAVLIHELRSFCFFVRSIYFLFISNDFLHASTLAQQQQPFDSSLYMIFFFEWLQKF